MARDGTPKWPEKGLKKNSRESCSVYKVYEAMARDGTPKWPERGLKKNSRESCSVYRVYKAKDPRWYSKMARQGPEKKIARVLFCL